MSRPRQPKRAHLAFAVFLFAVALATESRASLPIVGLGTDSFEVAPEATYNIPYSQTTDALVLSNSFPLGATLGGVFGSLASPLALDLNSYPAFGLSMTITDGFALDKTFSVLFYDGSFNPLNTFTGATSGIDASGGIAWLSLPLPSSDPFAPPLEILDLSSVAAMQFTWDDEASSTSTTTVFSLVGAEPQGYFVARSPGGFRLITSTATNGLVPAPWPEEPNGTFLPPGESAWLTLSDSNAKTTVTPVDHRATLRKVAALPVTSWNYKHDLHRRYVGPMAQDFHGSFGLGHDDKHISTLDTDGVTLSALKGLIAELQDRKAHSAAQAKRLAELEAELQALSEKLRVNNMPPTE